MFCPRELPKKKPSKEEPKSSQEELPDIEGPVSRQKKQLLVDCLTTIIRYLLFHASSFSLSHFSGCASPSFRSPGTSLPEGEKKRIPLQDPLTGRHLGQTRSNRAG